MDDRQTRLYFVALDELNLPLTTQVKSLSKRQKEKINEASVKWNDRDDELIVLFDKIVSGGLLDNVSLIDTLSIKDRHITYQPPAEVTRTDEIEDFSSPNPSSGETTLDTSVARGY
tara:strand:+ start:987 stop:1334 length:348 start_codon:yes stop_codon:yes gene_type:complete